MADLSFPILDPEATDSPTINTQKKGVAWRGVALAAASYTPGGGGNFWQMDSVTGAVQIDDTTGAAQMG